MNISDKMGGIVSLMLIKVDDIGRLYFDRETKQILRINMKPGKGFIEVPIRKNGVSINITPNTGKNGVLYSINLQADLKEDLKMEFPPFNKYMVVVRGANNSRKALGHPHYPLTATLTPVMGNTASAFSGEVLELTGKQPFQVSYFG